jgi:hypothetical protein
MPDSRSTLLPREAAETLAIQALGYIAQDGERLGRFLAITGMGPADIRAAANDRHFLVGVLDYLSGDEALLIAFAEHAGVSPGTISAAQQVLSGAGGDTGAV